MEAALARQRRWKNITLMSIRDTDCKAARFIRKYRDDFTDKLKRKLLSVRHVLGKQILD
jgi:hypothetical protein